MPRYDAPGSPRLQGPAYHAFPGATQVVDDGPPRRSHAMRRRLLVFFGVFLVSAIASLAYTFQRPAIYLADARMQVTPTDIAPSMAASGAHDPGRDFMAEMQILGSRPLLEEAARRMAGPGAPASLDASVQALQGMIAIAPVPGSNVVRIEARGPDAREVANVVNTVVAVYQERQARSGIGALEKQLADAREALRVMDGRVATRKAAVEEFRVRSAIVSSERDENHALARLKGQGASMARNDEREAAAEGRVRALEQAIAEGKRSPLAKDNPTLASMEARLSQLREDYRGLERQYTPQYLEMDPNARAVRTRITNLEQQLESERAKGQQSALADAREELASARATSQRLQQQQAGDRQNVQAFTRRFAEFKAMEDDLKGLEQMRQAARQRLVTLEATASERKPRTLVMEPAAVPGSAWRPLYARDAALSVGGSLALGFLAVWFVEFFNRSEPVVAAPATVIVSQPWTPPPPLGAVLEAGSAPRSLAHDATQEAPPPMGLIAQSLPRELAQHEVRQLLEAAAPEHVFVLLCLLCGLSAEETAALRVADVDAEGGQLRVLGMDARTVPLQGPLAALQVLPEGVSADQPLLPAAGGRPLTVADIASAVTSCAFDAGLEHAPSVTPESLRHTYVAFLVRQGLRFGELGRAVGRLPPETLHALAALSPVGARLPLSEVARTMPAVAALGDPRAQA